MFDCKQDIGLLHGSLLSAISNSESNSKKEDPVNVVHDSVKMIIKHSLSGLKEEKEKFQMRCQTNERLHAAIFFVTLNSCDIKSEDADHFYESILHNWPTVDWKFYLELNFKCDWSEYFIKCALQLPSDVLLEILNLTQDVPVDYHLQCYSWHLIIQTIMRKLLKVSHDGESEYPFNFNFSIGSKFRRYCVYVPDANKIFLNEDYIQDKVFDVENKIFCFKNKISYVLVEYCWSTDEEDMIPHFIEMFDCIFENVRSVGAEIEIVQVLCHGMKVLLKCLIEKNQHEIKFSVFSNFLQILSMLKKNLCDHIIRDILKAELLMFSNKFSSHTYATASWGISLNYLIFLLSYYFKKAYSSPGSFATVYKSERQTLCIDYMYKDCESVVDDLLSLSDPALESDEFVKTLCKTLQFGFQHSTYVAEFFLSKPAIMERDDVLMVLENSCDIISFSEIYSSLLDSVVKAKAQKTKLKLLNIFYKFLKGAKISVCNDVVGFILSKYGHTKEFELPDFDDQFSEFSRKTPTLKEHNAFWGFVFVVVKKISRESEEKVKKSSFLYMLEDALPALFIQNPLTVLQYSIDQVLIQGPEGKPFIQVLKHFARACLYQEKLEDLYMLHAILNEYFKREKLEAFEEKNMILLYEFLVEVHSETRVLVPCHFFRECIIPKLDSNFDKMELLLECAYVLLPALLPDEYPAWLSQYYLNILEKSIFSDFIISFAKLTDHFISSGSGKMKALVIKVLKKFENHQLKHKRLEDCDKVELWSDLKPHRLQEMTCVYIKEFLPENIEFKTKCYIWTWCCKSEDSAFFEHNFPTKSLSYVSLTNTLIRVFPHLTKEEWLYSINLLKICCDDHKLVEEIVHLNNPFELSGSELKIYAAVVAMVTSLHCILGSNADNMHISTCFSNSLMNLLDQKGIADTRVLLAAFLEVCHLISDVSPDLIPIFNSTLLALKKQITSSSAEIFKTKYVKLLSCAVTCLPDSLKDCVIQNV